MQAIVGAKHLATGFRITTKRYLAWYWGIHFQIRNQWETFNKIMSKSWRF